jgi:16S rRNA C967 or C1407 C5-methylase (RsmB/RsmF family)
MEPVDQERISVGSLDLPPGYYAERGETGVYLMDPDGRRVMRFSSDVASAGEHQETTRLKPSAKPGPEEWQELCRSLLIRLSQRSNECERLRVRVEELAERLEAAEAERDQANTIAEDLYEFFRNRVRETVDRSERSRGRPLSGDAGAIDS